MIGIFGALAVCITVGLIVGAVITVVLKAPAECPEGTTYDSTTGKCFEPCPEGYYLVEGVCYEIIETEPDTGTETETETPTVTPPVITCSEDEYLGVDGQCHPEDTPMMTTPDPNTDECQEGYYPCYMTECCKIPDEDADRLPGLSILPGTAGGAAIAFFALVAFVGLWWVYIKPRM